MKRLPDAEFEIMKVIWANEPPVNTRIMMEQLGNKREWKGQALLSFLSRLVERNFLRTEKQGKERQYYPLISKEDYLQFETNNFLSQYHDNSFSSFVNALYEGDKINKDDIKDLLKLIEEEGE